MNIQISNEANLPTRFGNFKIRSFRETKTISNETYLLEHLVIKTKEIPQNPLVRVHSECLTGDALGSLKCDCGGELQEALKLISKEQGMVIYLRQEGRGIGLFNKVNAYALQDEGLDTLEANLKLGFKGDERDYAIVKTILEYYNLKKIRLLTNNPAKINYFSNFIEVERTPIIIPCNEHNAHYLEVKKEKMGHLL
ncbi:GTP cyclohydrolase II [Helicobacter canadensis MIT 98-5491]|uniref:GTP cyclohydrolase-2 n=2 Tax=Helicobacter canadensis TaxID=123841 RepID=C5ZWB2_9HELI|nr:GTP cyclohydrolase II protein [Helicobacter canadensis MIT 98-5491]EFR48220.1 GTP cyclohydrolase II [Helicobacter canadensis MIT 98-5491]STO99468.1 GTP cyclohydrolase II [Helicobacter canadensis]